MVRNLDGAAYAALELHDEVVVHRDVMIDLLEHMIRIIDTIGGYMTPVDQSWLRAARAHLAEMGR